MEVFVTGGTGFVGSHVLEALVAAGHEVTALERPGDRRSGLPSSVKKVVGDVLDPDLARLVPEGAAVVHLVGIIREDPGRGVTFERLHLEATRRVVEAMGRRGSRRLLHMSALGAAETAPTDYFRTKARAEAEVRASGLDWTIFRPSIVFGPGDTFVNMLAGQVLRMPVVPVIGDGSYRLQPVHASDVASGFAQAVLRDDTAARAFEVGGPEQMTYDELLDRVARALGRRRARKCHLPLGLMRPTIRGLERFGSFPITTGQLEMLLMSNVCDPAPFFETFSIAPTTFDEGVAGYLGGRARTSPSTR